MLKVTQFRVGVVQLGARLDVTRVRDGNGPKQKLHVLLRNKRSPRLQGWFERDVLPESFELTNQAPR